MSSNKWVRNNKVSVAIVIYIIAFAAFAFFKPAFLYNEDGTLRHFGVGYRSKTIIPIWLLSMFLGIMSYFFVLYYSNMAL